MRYLLFTISLTLSTVTCLAQSEELFNVSAGLTYNYRVFLPADNFTEELPAIHYHFGIAYVQPLSERIGFSGGLGYRTLGTKTKPNELRWGIQHDGTGGFDPTQSVVDLTQELQFFSQHRFLQAPIGLRIQAKNNQHRYWQFGLNNMIYLQTRSKLKTDDAFTNTAVERISFIRNFHTALQLEMGWLWPLGESPLRISLAPSFQFHLTPLNLDGSSKEYPFNGGLTVGLWW